jgi:formylglycine-generating enzyme required for sulfatase activity
MTTVTPYGVSRASTWQGAFPIQNAEEDGYKVAAPAGCFDPNDYGLYDMIGNVWEWTLSKYELTRTPNSYTIKVGSFLYAPNYHARY